MALQKIEEKMVVPYTSEQVFGLVNDVEEYSHFIPWCVSSHILSRQDKELVASLSFAKGGMQKSFTTRNVMTPCERITMDLVDGPFKHLSGCWEFIDQEEGGCSISLRLEFEFSNRIVAMMFGAVFHQVVHSLVKSFSQRAQEVYE